MEESEMVALKKAYAEIILNTAKEAASRVMESDRRAVRFQRDLVRTQNEAVRMLIRLKQMMEFKITEAEKSSVRERTRIEELEAQLQEAEDKIVDLRMDLQKVGDELEKLKKNRVQPCHKQHVKEDAFSPNNERNKEILPPLGPMVPYSSDSDLETAAFNAEDGPSNKKDLFFKSCNLTKQNELSSFSYLKSDCNFTSALGSEMVRSKEPEPCRNGCTNKSSSHGGQSQLEKHRTTGGESLSSANQLNFKASSFLFPRANILRKQVRVSGEEVKKPVKVCKNLRRKGRSRQIQACSRRSSSMQLAKCSRTSAPPPKMGSVNSNAKPDCSPDECFKSKVKKNYVELQDKLMDGNGSLNEDRALTFKCKRKARRKRIGNAYTSSNQMDVQFEQRNQILSGANSIDHVEIQSMPDLDPQSALRKSHEKSRSTEKVLNARGEELRDDFSVTAAGTDTTESLMLQNHESGSESSKFFGLNPDLDDAKSSKENRGSAPANDSRLLKYTFQRKRKKEPLACTNDNGLPEKSELTRKEAGDTGEGEREPKKPALMNESFQDSGGLAQVARQLIALSGKRWW